MGENVGFFVNDSVYVYLVLFVVSYVGGDIIVGVLLVGIWLSEENVLFIDLGINGEIVFGNKDYMMSCVCLVGFVFEGGGISCGMRVLVGVIEKVIIDKDILELILKIIDECVLVGICGFGIIDLIC